MNNRVVITAGALISSLGLIQTAHAFTACSINTQGQVDTVMAGSSPDHCYKDALAIKLSAYKIGLCTELPYVTNYAQVCDFIYDSVSPLSLIGEIDKVRPIEGLSGVTLPQGKAYTHTVLLISNKVFIKDVVEYDSVRLGRSGTGNYCWSLGVSFENSYRGIRSGFGAECGTKAESEAATAGYNWNTATMWWPSNGDTANAGKYVVERNFPNYQGGQSNQLLSSPSTLAAFNSGSRTISDDDSNLSTNTAYRLVGRAISSPITMTANLTSFEIGIQTTNSHLMNFAGVHSTSGDHSPVECASTPCVTHMQSAGMGIRVTVK